MKDPVPTPTTIPKSVRRGPPITLTCECGETRHLRYGDRWTCEKCSRSWDTTKIPVDQYAAVRSTQLRFRRVPIAISVLALAQGAWDAIAKLENALARLDRDGELRLTHFRTGAKEQQSNLLPYVIEVVAADKPGVLFQLAEFFAQQNITIEQLHSTRYRAMQTGADMFSAQITIGIPTTTHIAALRDDFLEFCDGLNLDAIMDPMKF